MKKIKISNAVIRRMPRYYRHLEALERRGVERISSKSLSSRTGLTASQIRQDLACFGEFGHQGYGYNVSKLKTEVAEVLGMTNNYTAVIVGVGRMGKALIANFPFRKYGITVTAAYDIDPNIVGREFCNIPVYHVNELAEHLAMRPVDLAVLTASANAAHPLADVLASANVGGIWNYTNVELRPRTGNPMIEDVHLFDSLFSLCCRVTGESAFSENCRMQA